MKLLLILTFCSLVHVRTAGAEPNAALLHYRAFAFGDLLVASLGSNTVQELQSKFFLADYTDARSEQYFKAAAPAIELARQAATIEPCNWGVSQVLDDGVLGYFYVVGRSRDLARLVVNHVEFQARQMQGPPVEDLLAALQIARHLYHGVPISLGVVWASRSISVQPIESIIRHLNALRPAEIESILAVLRGDQAVFSGSFREAYEGEIRLQRQLLERFAHSEDLTQPADADFAARVHLKSGLSANAKPKNSREQEMERYSAAFDFLDSLAVLFEPDTPNTSVLERFKARVAESDHRDLLQTWLRTVEAYWNRTQNHAERLRICDFLLSSRLQNAELLSSQNLREMERLGWEVERREESVRIVSTRTFGTLRPAALEVLNP